MMIIRTSGLVFFRQMGDSWSISCSRSQSELLWLSLRNPSPCSCLPGQFQMLRESFTSRYWWVIGYNFLNWILVLHANKTLQVFILDIEITLRSFVLCDTRCLCECHQESEHPAPRGCSKTGRVPHTVAAGLWSRRHSTQQQWTQAPWISAQLHPPCQTSPAPVAEYVISPSPPLHFQRGPALVAE